MSIAEALRPASSQPFHTAIWSGIAKEQTGYLKGLNEDATLLHRIGSKLNFSRGETIFNDGDPAQHTYELASGVVRLCKHMADGRRQIAQFMLPGDFFSFMDTAEHSFTAEAVNDVILFCYPYRQIERLADERPSMRKNFTAALTRQVRDIQNHLVTLGRQSAEEKLAAFLLLLAGHNGARTHSTLDVPMSRKDISDYLGLTAETVCRTLSSMKREGLIEIPNLHQIVIRDFECLGALSEGEG